MASRDFSIGMIFLSQIIVGFLENFFLLYHYSFLCFTRSMLWSTDLILKHLIVANFLVILSKGIPQTMAAFGPKDSLSDIGCKLVFYVHRVGRTVCIGNACLLSVFQVITISPSEFRWAQLKLHAPRYIRSFNILVLCWILNMLVNITVPLHVTGKWNSINSTKTNDYKYCSGRGRSRILQSLHIWLHGFYPAQLKQQVQHIHGTNLSPRSSPESRVTQSILVLVSTLCYFTRSPPSLHVFFLIPVVSPFVLMSSHPRIPRLGSACCGRNPQFPKLIR
uniref:Vomeronasal type-1 receptor n=1 Tax=Gorilla gorilla gorilla TaxID=9595 RepID=A0A2I2YK18_GORGO